MKTPYGITLEAFLKDLKKVVESAVRSTELKVNKQGYKIQTNGKLTSHKVYAVVITLPKDKSPRTMGMTARQARLRKELHFEEVKQRRDYFVKRIESAGYLVVPTIKDAEQIILTVYIKE